MARRFARRRARPGAAAVSIAVALAGTSLVLVGWCHLPARLATFLGFLGIDAVDNSHGKIGHGNHLALYALFMALFLPSDTTKRWQKLALLRTVFATQAVILASYSLSGLWKLTGMISQLRAGDLSALSMNGASYQLADRMLQPGQPPLIGDWLVGNQTFLPVVYLGAIGIELFSLGVLFIPCLHRLWGVLVVSLHIGIYVTMGIRFDTHSVVAALFLYLSPFAEPLFNRPRPGSPSARTPRP